MANNINLTYKLNSGQRLDRFLVESKIHELYSRNFIEKLIADQCIIVNNAPVKKSYVLRKGDKINIVLPPPPPQEVIPQDIPMDIIYEDEYLAVINKPAGLVVHPGYGNPEGTLVNAVVYKYGKKLVDGISRNRPGIVHRLDKETSGLIIIAKDDETQSKLSSMFSQRQVKKTYLAITTGVPEPSEETIETYITRSTKNPRMMVVGCTGRLAITFYSVLRFYHNFALLKVNLETGRMHQIRVHMVHKNTPILGDLVYNKLKNVQNIVPDNMKKRVYDLLINHLKRQALHAWKLKFNHPYSLNAMEFTAPIPADFNYALNWLENHFAIDNDRFEKILK